MGASSARMVVRGQNILADAGLADLSEITSVRGQMCASCAGRAGTVPNGCLQTQMDLLKAAAEGAPFLCHAPHDGRICAGWIAMRAFIAANPLPAEALALIAKWEFSE